MTDTKEIIKKEVKKWINKLNKKQLLKVRKFLIYFSKVEVEFKPNRIFHVDVAQTIVENGVKKWKASLVENEKHVKSYNIGEFLNSIPVENCGILKVVEYLVEQKWKGKLLIYTDSQGSLTSFYNDHLFQVFLRKGEESIEMKKTKKFYLMLARKLAQENGIDLKLEWIKGADNLADYYSRQQELKEYE